MRPFFGLASSKKVEGAAPLARERVVNVSWSLVAVLRARGVVCLGKSTVEVFDSRVQGRGWLLSASSDSFSDSSPSFPFVAFVAGRVMEMSSSSHGARWQG